MKYFLIAVFLFYFIYTLLFAIKLHKSHTLFSRKIKLIHHILIWLIPFIWVILLKALLKPIPGSHKAKKEIDAGFYESGIGESGDGGSGHH
jgi:GT2 family glycosyltransferase